MGFTFSGIHKELASERFKRLYEELRIESSLLDSFPSSSSLISFFHDAGNKEYGLKDSVLYFLITAYRRGDKYGQLAPFFIALFTNAIASVYRMSKKINNKLDDEEFFQDVCVMLLQIVKASKIIPHKVALQITNQLKNETWSLANRSLSQSRLEVTTDINRIISLAGSNEEIDIEPDIPDAYALLDDLVQRRVITQADKKIILATVIEGKSLKDISAPRDYEKLKKRRQRAIRAVETHLANKLKL